MEGGGVGQLPIDGERELRRRVRRGEPNSGAITTKTMYVMHFVVVGRKCTHVVLSVNPTRAPRPRLPQSAVQPPEHGQDSDSYPLSSTAMPDPTAALYVRLPHPEFEKLDRAAEALATNKKTLVTTLVSHYVDPDSDAGLDRLRAIANQPPPRRVTIDLPNDNIAVGHHAFTPAPLPDVLTPTQAAELLQVSEDEVVALAEAGTLPGRRIGERWRFSRPALITWLAGG
jgi:excisionase family DNA binding protein